MLLQEKLQIDREIKIKNKKGKLEDLIEIHYGILGGYKLIDFLQATSMRRLTQRRGLNGSTKQRA